MAAICKSTLVARHNAILAQGHQASINVGPCAGELLIILQTMTSALWINDTVIPNVCLLCRWTHTPKKWWSSPFLPPPLPFLIPPFSFAGLLVPPHLPRTPASSSCQLLCPITNWHAIRIRLPRRPTSVMSFRSHWWKSQSHNVAQFPNYLFSPRAAFLTPLESVSVFICSSISVFYPREGGKKKANPISLLWLDNFWQRGANMLSHSLSARNSQPIFCQFPMTVCSCPRQNTVDLSRISEVIGTLTCSFVSWEKCVWANKKKNITDKKLNLIFYLGLEWWTHRSEAKRWNSLKMS